MAVLRPENSRGSAARRIFLAPPYYSQRAVVSLRISQRFFHVCFEKASQSNVISFGSSLCVDTCVSAVSQVSNIFTMSQSRLHQIQNVLARLMSRYLSLGQCLVSEKNVLTPSLNSNFKSHTHDFFILFTFSNLLNEDNNYNHDFHKRLFCINLCFISLAIYLATLVVHLIRNVMVIFTPANSFQ